jgi:hypothetical protein
MKLLPVQSASTKPPLEVIEDFFTTMSLDDVRSQLGSLLYIAMTRDSTAFDNGLKRDSAIFFCQQLEQLAEAAFILTKGMNKQLPE